MCDYVIQHGFQLSESVAFNFIFGKVVPNCSICDMYVPYMDTMLLYILNDSIIIYVSCSDSSVGLLKGRNRHCQNLANQSSTPFFFFGSL